MAGARWLCVSYLALILLPLTSFQNSLNNCHVNVSSFKFFQNVHLLENMLRKSNCSPSFSSLSMTIKQFRKKIGQSETPAIQDTNDFPETTLFKVFLDVITCGKPLTSGNM